MLDQIRADLGRDQRRATGIFGVEAQFGGKRVDAASGGRDGTRIADRKLLHLLPTSNGHARAYAGLRPDIEFVGKLPCAVEPQAQSVAGGVAIGQRQVDVADAGAAVLEGEAHASALRGLGSGARCGIRRRRRKSAYCAPARWRR